jgi:hypothetical protein
MSADVSRQGRVATVRFSPEDVPTHNVFLLEDRVRKVYADAFGDTEYQTWIDYMKNARETLKNLLKEIRKTGDGNSNNYPLFEHRGIHDTESLFWVMAWSFLLISPQGDSAEIDQPAFSKLINGMIGVRGWHESRHILETRDTLYSEQMWSNALGRGLTSFCGMLASLQDYFNFPWYRLPDLDTWFVKAHGFEVLRRHLLTAIMQCLPKKDMPFQRGDLNENNPLSIQLHRGRCVDWKKLRETPGEPGIHLAVPIRSTSHYSSGDSASFSTKRARSESAVTITRSTSRSKKQKSSVQEDTVVMEIVRFSKLRSKWLP